MRRVYLSAFPRVSGGAPIDEHRAGAALGERAPEFGARQTGVVPEDLHRSTTMPTGVPPRSRHS
jgi:hypothetical protein